MAVSSNHATLGTPTLGVAREGDDVGTASSADSPSDSLADSPTDSPADSPDLAWLIRLRWLAAAGQLVGYYIVRPTTAEWAQPWLIAVVAATTLSNLLLRQFRVQVAAGASRIWRASETRRASETLGASDARSASRSGERAFSSTGLVLTFDCALLTAWLGFTGGTTNPFTSLYLVHIVLGAVVLNARWTVWLITWAAVCFGVLFVVPAHTCCVPQPEGVESAYLSHMQGMWFAFATAAILISYFVRQLTLSAERQRERIAVLRLEAERSAHMASLTTLAAGAAHELRTPLGTIAVAAHELRRNAERGGSSEVLEDATLIAEEVERCQAILSGMGLRLRAGAEPKTRVSACVVQQTLGAEFAAYARLVVQTPQPDVEVLAVEADLVVALRGLVNNALDATEMAGNVTVSCAADRENAVWTITDTGVGMSESVRARALEPFYTTKPAGKGVGLGMFVAHALAVSSEGLLTLESKEGEGTTVRLALPKYQRGSAA
jgi:two-component system, sensor histidine kinase RegB